LQTPDEQRAFAPQFVEAPLKQTPQLVVEQATPSWLTHSPCSSAEPQQSMAPEQTAPAKLVPELKQQIAAEHEPPTSTQTSLCELQKVSLISTEPQFVGSPQLRLV
jgi:hypothetical protein